MYVVVHICTDIGLVKICLVACGVHGAVCMHVLTYIACTFFRLCVFMYRHNVCLYRRRCVWILSPHIYLRVRVCIVHIFPNVYIRTYARLYIYFICPFNFFISFLWYFVFLDLFSLFLLSASPFFFYAVTCSQKRVAEYGISKCTTTSLTHTVRTSSNWRQN